MREGGGNCLKYLKKGWNRKEGRETKILKVGGKLGQGVGALKRGGSWKPLTNYDEELQKMGLLFYDSSFHRYQFINNHGFS